MEMFWTLLLLVVGLALIIKGGDFFVDAASWMAEASGVPKFLIGATVVSIATTLPELFVSVLAASQGKVDFAVGNAVGSVTANTSLVLGIALIFMPTAIKRKKYLTQSLVLLVAATLVVVCGFMGQVSLAFNLVLLGLLVFFMVYNVRSARLESALAEGEVRTKPARREVAVNLVKFVAGAAGIVVGADLLVNSGSTLATLFGVPERIIGVTIIALGTSLPELVTTLTAIAKKQASLSVGNIIGANILNFTCIMPVASLVSGSALPISATMARVDLPASLLVCAIALVPALVMKKFSRWQGVLLVALYVAYIALTTLVFV